MMVINVFHQLISCFFRFAFFDEDKPNVIHEVVNYKNSTLPNVGPEIMQLREEEDNRDGYIIRIVSEKLAK
ncbi:hypothetical protein ACT4UT_28075, partial [Bacillus sp. B-TM1]